ncbi:MAG: hypothetical protein HC817_03210, partial [Saprospiraceae bacterium]|nr:hypothetical protein [Saprospiraceae bacterium]
MKFILKNILIFAAVLSINSCDILEVEKIPDLNNPTIESVLTDATLAQVGQLGVGVQLALRTNYYELSWIAGS